MAKLKRHDNFLTEKGNYDPKEFYKGKTLDPKTPVNMAKYRLALNAAEQNILSAIKALKYIPRIDWDETIPDTINKLETLLSSDNGEAGFSLFVAKAEKDGLKESADSALAIDGMELPKYFKGDDLKYIKNLQSGQSLQAQDKKGKFVRVNYANKLYTLIYDKLSESILESKEVFWLSNVPSKDDFGKPIADEFIDGKTKMGPWAMMSPESWRQNGVGRLGVGYGQRYKKQKDDKWLKVE